MLNTKPRVQEKENAKEFEWKEGKIEIKNLAFKHYDYDQKVKNSDNDKEKQVIEKMILDDFSLDIKPGTTNAIVGQSGFGKTTLFNLLFRIYDPENGLIKIDGQDLKDLQFDSFRKYISIIPQNGILFNDTILHNLQYSNDEATFEEIVEVAKQCEIHDKIMSMPDGYDTKVGDLGNKLSGGER